MSDSNAGQRKMMRGMSPGGGSAFHDAPLARGTTSESDRRTKRAAKKQIKTRENRAERRGQL
jgi:hypothetical protein